MMEKHTLKVLVDDVSESRLGSAQKAARPSLENFLHSAGAKVIELESSVLSAEVSKAYNTVVQSLTALSATDDTLKLKSVSFTLAIDSTGGVSLLSSFTGTIKTQAGITFVLAGKEG